MRNSLLASLQEVMFDASNNNAVSQYPTPGRSNCHCPIRGFTALLGVRQVNVTRATAAILRANGVFRRIGGAGRGRGHGEVRRRRWEMQVPIVQEAANVLLVFDSSNGGYMS
jgi:hypothetical protein